MRKKIFFLLIGIATGFIFFTGCVYNEAIITYRSEPTGANVYDENNSYLGRTPFSVTYEIPEYLYEYGASSWNIGYVKAYSEGYEPETIKVLIDISGQTLTSWRWKKVEKYYYNFQIIFNSAKTQQTNINDEFYISSFQETTAGKFPPKRDSFNKSEIPEVIIVGSKGKIVNIKVYTISSSRIVFDESIYIPAKSNIYMHLPIKNLIPASYKVNCQVEGINVKTLFFIIYN